MAEIGVKTGVTEYPEPIRAPIIEPVRLPERVLVPVR